MGDADMGYWGARAIRAAAAVAPLAAAAGLARQLQYGPGDYSAAKRFRRSGLDGNITRVMQRLSASPRGGLRLTQGSLRRYAPYIMRRRYRSRYGRNRPLRFAGAYRPYKLRQYSRRRRYAGI